MSKRRVSIRGNADRNWKETVWRAAKRFPPRVRENLTVDWTDGPLHGGAAYAGGGRILIGWDPSGYNPRHAIEHELAHRAFEMLPSEVKNEAQKVFSKWIVKTPIAKTYETAEKQGTWQRDDPRYTDVLTVRKRVSEQAAEAIRASVMRESLPRQAKVWAAKASRKSATSGDGDVDVSAHEREGKPVSAYTRSRPGK